ncbi:MAG: nuclear transport factor 2 family protein [Gemmatimonadota bacterium]
MIPARNFLTLALAVTLLASGCQEPARRMDPAMAAARRDSLKAFFAERYSAFENGNWDAWVAQMGDSAFLTAADPGRSLSGRDSILAAMRSDYAPAFAAGLTMHVASDSQEIWMDDSARVAAVTADLDYQITIQGQHVPLTLRATTLLARDSVGWKVLVEHYSRQIAQDSLFLALAAHQVVGPAPVGQSVPESAGELVNQFRRDLKDFAKAALADSVVVVTPGEIARGAGPARAALTNWLGLPGNATEANTGVRTALAPGATTGWLATTLYVPIFAGPESLVAPIRVLLIYHIAGDHWEIVQAHFSVGWSPRS